MATFSIFATWFGAETIVGAAGSLYSDGLSGGSADPFGYGLCLIVLGLVVAAPLWRRQYTTFGDLFRERYSPGVERLAVLLMVPTSVLWAAAQIRAFGQVVSASSDLDVTIAISAAAGFVIIYTVAGGLLADVVTDFVQSIAIVIGLAILLVAVGNAHGGLAALPSLIDPARLGLFSTADATPLEMLEAWAVPVCGSLLAVEMLSRILGCKSAATARNATLTGAAIYLTVGLIPATLGLVGPALVPNLEEPEQLIAVLAQQHLSTFLYVLFAGALISAILSTVDSCLLAAASLVSHNLILPLKPTLSERGKIRAARIGVVVFGILAYVIALRRRRDLRARGDRVGIRQRGHLRRRLVRALQSRRRRTERVRGARRRRRRVGGRRILARLVDALRRGRGRGARGVSRRCGAGAAIRRSTRGVSDAFELRCRHAFFAWGILE